MHVSLNSVVEHLVSNAYTKLHIQTFLNKIHCFQKYIYLLMDTAHKCMYRLNLYGPSVGNTVKHLVFFFHIFHRKCTKHILKCTQKNVKAEKILLSQTKLKINE